MEKNRLRKELGDYQTQDELNLAFEVFFSFCKFHFLGLRRLLK